MLRSCLGWCVLSRKDFLQCWFESGDNFADDPSRHNPLRRSETAPEHLKVLLQPACDEARRGKSARRLARICSMEVLSGRGRLSAAWRWRGFTVARPMEAFPSKGVYASASDLSAPGVLRSLTVQIKKGAFFYVHFAVPCSSWSCLQRINGSTRTKVCPKGDETFPDIKEGNDLAETVSHLCWLLSGVGSYWSIENPHTSLLWDYQPILGLLDVGLDVVFDQCMHGLIVTALNLPPPQVRFVRKRTRVRTNMSSLKALECTCSHSDRAQSHLRCFGTVQSPSGWTSVAKSAGAYPHLLCQRWASLVPTRPPSALERPPEKLRCL